MDTKERIQLQLRDVSFFNEKLMQAQKLFAYRSSQTVENLGNFMQANPIVAASQPFSNYFDASMVWGPITGRMVYVGWRYKIK